MVLDEGGKMFINSSTIKMLNCHFVNNTALQGAGIVMYDSMMWMRNTPTTKTIPGIQNNSAIGLNGTGGSLDATTSNTTIHQCSFSNNTSLNIAGALSI
jgi:hypothetical protein